MSETGVQGEAISQPIERLIGHVRQELAKGLIGQQEFVNQILVALLCGGHALIEGVPGIAKTLVVKLIARILKVEFQRIQSTPDLMPADVLGTSMFHMPSGEFRLHRGPIFTDLLLVDEINRMPPRTQAALLEAMEERQVTIDGVRHPLNALFTVFATQNPVEFEGTYPLPEAQLDRFLLKIRVPYPEAEEELRILEQHQKGFDPRQLDSIGIVALEPETMLRARAALHEVRVEPALLGYVAEIARRSRGWPSLALGASPRAAVSLLASSKALAALDGRDYLLPDDVKTASLPVLRHRLRLKPEAELEGLESDSVIRDIVSSVSVPK